MIVVQNNIRVKDEYRNEFEQRFIGRNRSVDKFPGFIRNEILRPIKGENYIVMTYWNSMEEFRQWTESEEFRSSHSGINDSMFSGKNFLTIHEVIDTTEK